jgi:hypothetical protein
MIRLFSRLISEAHKKPYFVAASVDEKTRHALATYIVHNGIPNPIPIDELHTTILYSRKPTDPPKLKDNPKYQGEPVGFEVWDTKTSNSKSGKALVLRVKCSDLEGRHAKLMKDLDASYDFPEYKTHITLSYDCGAINPAKLPLPDFKIVYNEEYAKVLDLDWKPGDGK